MQHDGGLFIVLEGADGSGKTTQFNLLGERLKAMGYEIEVFDFPRYDHPSSHFVRQYLNGYYGPASSVSPYTASMFYALDRYEAAPAIRSALKENKIVLSNRYVGSNMAHQGSKFKNPVEQRGFFIWEDGLEYNLLSIPRPTINIYLRVPAETSFNLIGEKAARNYTPKTHDEHEADIEHLRQSVATYDLLTQLFPKDFTAIECTQEGKLLGVPEINNLIWEVLRPILPQQRPRSGRRAVVQLNHLYYPVKNTGPVAGSNKNAVASKLPAASGDNIQLCLDNISLLAVNSMLGISDAQINKKIITTPDNLVYYQPQNVDKELSKIYRAATKRQHALYQQAFESFDRLSASKKQYAAKAFDLALPLSSLTSVSITGSVSGIKKLAVHLSASKISELNWVANQLLKASKKLYPDIFRSFQLPSKNSNHDFMSLYMNGLIRSRGGDSTEPVKLLSAWPRNEFDVLADSVYTQTDLPRNDIIAEIESWPYEEKFKALKKAISSGDNNIFDQVKYRWDVISDYKTVEPLINTQVFSEVQSQAATVRYGYDVPEVIEEHNLDELYMECFDNSLAYFSEFQTLSEELAGYLVLYGHKRRWLFTTTYSGLLLSYKTASQGTKKLLDRMMEQLMETHPVLAEGIIKTRIADKIKSRPDKAPSKNKGKAKRSRK